MSYMTLCMWVAKFRSGLWQLYDAACPGKPATTTVKYAGYSRQVQDSH